MKKLFNSRCIAIIMAVIMTVAFTMTSFAAETDSVLGEDLENNVVELENADSEVLEESTADEVVDLQEVSDSNVDAEVEADTACILGPGFDNAGAIYKASIGKYEIRLENNKVLVNKNEDGVISSFELENRKALKIMQVGIDANDSIWILYENRDLEVWNEQIFTDYIPFWYAKDVMNLEAKDGRITGFKYLNDFVEDVPTIERIQEVYVNCTTFTIKAKGREMSLVDKYGNVLDSYKILQGKIEWRGKKVASNEEAFSTEGNLYIRSGKAIYRIWINDKNKLVKTRIGNKKLSFVAFEYEDSGIVKYAVTNKGKRMDIITGELVE